MSFNIVVLKYHFCTLKGTALAMCVKYESNTVKPRVSGHLLPSKKCPDTRECPDKRGSTKIVVHPCKYYRIRTQT